MNRIENRNDEVLKMTEDTLMVVDDNRDVLGDVVIVNSTKEFPQRLRSKS